MFRKCNNITYFCCQFKLTLILQLNINGMETTKAKFLNKYLLTSIIAFNDLLERNSLEEYEVNGELVYFKDIDFENHFNNFEKELREVILRTMDIEVALDYIDTCLQNIISWDGFNIYQYQVIFAKGQQVNLLYDLKERIEKYTNLVKSLFQFSDGDYPKSLIEFYNETIKSTGLQIDENIIYSRSTTNRESKPVLDIRFDYENMKAECDDLKSTHEKILFIHDRLYYFKQWQLQYDVEEMFLYKFSPTYYPNFEKLCQMELERLDKKLELEKKLNIPSIKVIESRLPEKEPAKNPYKWNSSNNDLIELLTAMYMVNVLKREDGVKITHTELTDFFEELFNLEVKNDKATRAYISDPLTTRPLFLEKLKKGFNEYRESKTEKRPEPIKTRKTGY